MSVLDLAASRSSTGTKPGPIIPVLLSGGAGTRLWPLSRETYPKQFLSLLGEQTLLQQTITRAADRSRFAAPIVVANQEHRFLIAEQLRALGVNDPTIVLEPARRNTAPAATIAALLARKSHSDAMLLVMPVDHLVEDIDGFNEAVNTAIPAAADGQLVLFGIRPTTAATGYGYIKIGEPIIEGVSKVDRFIEKPAREVADRLVKEGSYVWNSGIFLLPVRTFLEEMEQFAPDVLKACKASLEYAKPDLDFLRLPEQQFSASPSISIDYAVLEKTDRAAIVPARFDWNDIGSFSALWDVGSKDDCGNVEIGDIVS
ncbi:MAG: mannose-1-phosphate guanylyltransferase/mannose-6-phosphate isomerase, partial [Thermomicrobiales bacterium]